MYRGRVQLIDADRHGLHEIKRAELRILAARFQCQRDRRHPALIDLPERPSAKLELVGEDRGPRGLRHDLLVPVAAFEAPHLLRCTWFIGAQAKLATVLVLLWPL